MGVKKEKPRGVKKYKPAHTPHLFQQETEDGNARAARVSNAAAATIAHTRELLRHSRELIERTKARAKTMQATAERTDQLNDRLNEAERQALSALPLRPKTR